MNNKICKVCTKEFIPRHHKEEFCSDECRKEHRKEHRKSITTKHYRYGIDKRGKPCIICGYDLTTDVHHEGKTLVILCPNHHALITRKIKTLGELLLEKSNDILTK